MASRLQSLVGIDLGTTFTSVAYLQDYSNVVALPNAEGELLTPSVVFLSERDGAIVGTEALKQGYRRPERMVARVKRKMGSRKPCAGADGVYYTPVDISALILKKVIRDVATQIGPIRDAVITVPAHSSPIQRQHTIAAGKRAGLENVGIVSEPVAAALSYVLGGGAFGAGVFARRRFWTNSIGI
jgi:molecular chaperone DnaK